MDEEVTFIQNRSAYVGLTKRRLITDVEKKRKANIREERS